MGRPKKEKPNRSDGLYEIKITIGKTIDGKLIRKSFYSSISKEDAKKQAEAWRVNQKVAEQTGETFLKHDNIKFSTWAKKWLSVYKLPNVDINTYRMTYENTVANHLIPHFGEAVLTDIMPADIQNFYNKKQTDLSQSMMSKLKMCLNAIFETAIENELCYKNPAKRIEPVSKKEKFSKTVYSNPEIAFVEEHARDKMPEVVILLETGLRRGELLGLCWDDVDLLHCTITVNRSIAGIAGGGIKVNPPKWNSYRTNPLSDKAVEILKSLPRIGEYVFPLPDGRMQTPNTWSQRLKRYMSQLSKDAPQIAMLTAHELRHTYGTALRRKEIDIYTIQKVMGHRDIKVTTEIYVHNEIEVLRKAIERKINKK